MERDMARKKHDSTSLYRLHPNEIVRRSEGPKFFGYSSSQIDELIRKRKLPKPFKLVPGGRAAAWTGQQVIDYQESRLTADQSEDDNQDAAESST
jgi:predicted DNA-binding transcriptional regulator AlpA